jgi:hypothetical protein
LDQVEGLSRRFATIGQFTVNHVSQSPDRIIIKRELRLQVSSVISQILTTKVGLRMSQTPFPGRTVVQEEVNKRAQETVEERIQMRVSGTARLRLIREEHKRPRLRSMEREGG